jgi:phospholipid/cholesterol/gamma-HCH transport system ATP-binding protein
MILRYQRLHGFTAIMVSHEIPEVFSISHRVAVLDEGRIIHECAGDEIQGSQNRRVQQLIQGKENEADIVL